MHKLSSTHPKVCNGVDLEGEVNLVIREVQELCATDNTSIVHKDRHISHILLYLEEFKTDQNVGRLIMYTKIYTHESGIDSWMWYE